VLLSVDGRTEGMTKLEGTGMFWNGIVDVTIVMLPLLNWFDAVMLP
jgi:hypothetical protein